MILGRVSLEELHAKGWYRRSTLRRELPDLVKQWYVVSFNIGEHTRNKYKPVQYHKIYCIHNDKFLELQEYIRQWHTDEQWYIEYMDKEDIRIVIDGDEYKRNDSIKCMEKNGKRLDIASTIRGEFAKYIWKQKEKRIQDSTVIFIPKYLPNGVVSEIKQVIKKYKVKKVSNIVKDLH